MTVIIASQKADAANAFIRAHASSSPPELVRLAKDPGAMMVVPPARALSLWRWLESSLGLRSDDNWPLKVVLL